MRVETIVNTTRRVVLPLFSLISSINFENTQTKIMSQRRISVLISLGFFCVSLSFASEVIYSVKVGYTINFFQEHPLDSLGVKKMIFKIKR